MNPFLQQSQIPGVKHILAVGSGKGGVGKSTVAVNLALSLKERGAKVGLLDADFYGPSIPRMLGLLAARPEMTEDNKIVPVSSFGMKVMSIGFMVEENSAIIWRGPMLFKAMDQFFRDVQWGELDYLVIDLPPGTGDVTLTMAQKVPVSGGIVVCTPQNIALSDCKKAIDMFERVNVPILGVIENMAGYQTPSGEIVPLFPQGQLRHYLEIKKIPLLGSLAFDPEVGLACEAGIPFVQSNPESVFKDLAGKALERVQN